MNATSELSKIKSNTKPKIKVFDPAIINDELAIKTNWTPLVKSPLLVDNCFLYELNPSRIAFSPSRKATNIRFTILILFCTIFWIIAAFLSDETGAIGYIAAVFISIVIFVLGYILTKRLFQKKNI